jgi:hypothetical protein
MCLRGQKISGTSWQKTFGASEATVVQVNSRNCEVARKKTLYAEPIGNLQVSEGKLPPKPVGALRRPVRWITAQVTAAEKTPARSS